MVIGITLAFMGLMALVCFAAYSRPSGSTRQDMAKAQFVRFKAIHKKAVKEIAQGNK